jgi:caffeoyl-CoA O-methyltransferase
MNNKIFEDVDNYISNLLGKESKALREVTQFINENKIPNASISPNQGKLLQVLALTCNAKRILELGTMGAYSTIWLAEVLPSDGKVISIEFDPFHFEVAKKNIENAGLSSKIELRLGKAVDILPELEKEKQPPFDMIFIDADKPPYTEYVQWAIKLGRQGSVIVADNVIRNGKVLDQNTSDEKVQGVQRLNKMLENCQELTATILQTVGIKEYDGMVIAVINKK